MPTSPRRKTYPRIHPAPKQKEIGRQRKTARTRKSSPRSKRVGSDQSTLTQLDYVQAPHSNSRREAVAISSNDDEETYEEPRRSKRARKSTNPPAKETEEDDTKPRPAKRRKTSTEAVGKEKTQSNRKGRNNFRHTVRSRDQSTMTQKWDYTTPMLEIPDSEGEDEQTVMGTSSSSEGRQNEERLKQEVKTRHKGGISQTSTVKASGKRLIFLFQEDNDADSESETSPRPSRNTRSAASREQSSTQMTTTNSTKLLATPIKHVRTIIPSSVTPSTISSSAHSARQSQVYTRSPLKERSANIVGVGGRTPRSVANVDPKSIKKPWNGEPSQKHSDSPWTAKLTITPKKQTRRFERVTTIQDSEGESDWEYSPVKMNPLSPVFAPEPSKIPVVSQIDEAGNTQATSIRPAAAAAYPKVAPPSPDWRRTGVVQNSEECSLSTGSSPSSGGRTIDPARIQEDLTIPPQSAEVTQSIEICQNLANLDNQIRQSEREDRDSTPSPRKIQIAPLQTEQINLLNENEDNMDEDYYITDAEGQAENNNEYEDFDMYQQCTYDPVAAALEKDAACFGMTETQLNAEEPMLNEEDSYMDLDLKNPGTQAKVALPDGDVEFVPSSQPGEKTSILEKASGGIDDSGYGSHEEIVPSSQPGEKRFESSNIPLHSQHHDCSNSAKLPRCQPTQQPPFQPYLSQISTVCDTQSEKTDSRPNTAHGVPAAHGDEEEERIKEETVPTQPKSLWNNDENVDIDTLSSSPFPLPPGVTKLVHTGDTQITLTDFSLPPPPPLNWSSSLLDRSD